MKELIKLAFSAIEQRISRLEENFNKLNKDLKDLENLNQEYQTKLTDLQESLNNIVGFNKLDEEEEYKFGKQ